MENQNKENDAPKVKALSSSQKTITYEEAIEYATIGKFNYNLLFFCCAGLLAAIAELIGISVIIYAAQCDLKFTMQEKSLLAMSAPLGTIFSLHITGFICDTWGRIKTLRLTLILNICSSLISAFSVNTWMLICFRFLTGVFSSGCQCCLFSFLGEFLPVTCRRRHMTILATMVPVSILFVNLMAYWVLPLKLTDYIEDLSPWRALLLVNNVPGIIAFAGLMFLPESPKFLLAQGLYVEALEVIKKIFTTNTGKPAESYPDGLIMLNEKSTGLNNTNGFMEAMKLMGKQTLQLFHKKRILQTLNMSVIDLIVCIIGAGFTMWLPTVLSSFNDPDSEFLSVCAAIGISKNHSSDICSNPNGLETSHFKTLVYIALILIFCFLLSSVAVGFIGRKTILVFWFSAGAASAIVVYYVTDPMVKIVALTLVSHVGKLSGIVSGIAADFYPTSINAMGVCFVNMMSRIGIMVGGNIAGKLFLNYCETTFFTYAGILFVIVLMTAMMPKEKESKVIEQEDVAVKDEKIEIERF